MSDLSKYRWLEYKHYNIRLEEASEFKKKSYGLSMISSQQYFVLLSQSSSQTLLKP